MKKYLRFMKVLLITAGNIKYMKGHFIMHDGFGKRQEDIEEKYIS